MKQRVLLLTGLGIGLWLTANAQTPPSPIPTGYVYPVETTNNTVWIIGQRPLDRQGQLVGKGNFNQQLTQAFANVKTALASVNLTPANIRQITYHVRQLDNQRINLVQAAQNNYLSDQSQSIIQQKNVAQLVGDDMLIEIEVIAIKQ